MGLFNKKPTDKKISVPEARAELKKFFQLKDVYEFRLCHLTGTPLHGNRLLPRVRFDNLDRLMVDRTRISKVNSRIQNRYLMKGVFLRCQIIDQYGKSVHGLTLYRNVRE